MKQMTGMAGLKLAAGGSLADSRRLGRGACIIDARIQHLQLRTLRGGDVLLAANRRVGARRHVLARAAFGF
jgi:hypothetical protein